MNIIKTESLQNPRYNSIPNNIFCSLYPFSVESGETHICSVKTKEEAKSVIELYK